MALVELYRTTGERRYLELAARMVDLRGHGLLGTGRFGPAYWQDHAPGPRGRRRSPATPSASCTSTAAPSTSPSSSATAACSTPVLRRWHDMVETRTYLTGGLGSRHRDEAFGDPFELPPDRAYAETCAAIASVMLAWRLLLATGEPAYADAHRADDLQRRPAGRVARRDARSSTSTRCSGGPTARRRGRAVRRAPAVVRLRLLPAERHAPPQLVAAVPRDDRRRPASSSTSTRPPSSRADVAGGAGPPASRDRLPVGRRGRGHDPRDAGDAVDAVAAGAGLVRVGEPRGRRRRPRGGAGRRADASSGRGRGRPATRRPRPRHAVRVTRPRPARRRRPRLRRPRARAARLLRRDGRPAGRRRARGRRAWMPTSARPRRSRAPTSPGVAGRARRPRRIAGRVGAGRADRGRGDPVLRLGATDRSRRCGSGSPSRRRPTPAADRGGVRPARPGPSRRRDGIAGGAVDSRTTSVGSNDWMRGSRDGRRVARERDRRRDALADDLGDRHPQRRQRGHRVGGDEDVVEPDDRQLAGHDPPEAVGGVEDADGHEVGRGHDARSAARPARAGRRSAASPPARLFAHVLDVAVGGRRRTARP